MVGVGGDAVAASVGVVELHVDAPVPGAVQDRDPAVDGQGADRLHGVRVLSADGRGQAGAGLLAGKRPAPCRVWGE